MCAGVTSFREATSAGAEHHGQADPKAGSHHLSRRRQELGGQQGRRGTTLGRCQKSGGACGRGRQPAAAGHTHSHPTQPRGQDVSAPGGVFSQTAGARSGLPRLHGTLRCTIRPDHTTAADQLSSRMPPSPQAKKEATPAAAAAGGTEAGAAAAGSPTGAAPSSRHKSPASQSTLELGEQEVEVG